MDGMWKMKLNYKNYMLFIITLGSGFLLSLVYFLLFDQIQLTKKNEELKARKALIPAMVSSKESKDGLITAFDKSGSIVGYFYKGVDYEGYGGKVVVLVALNPDWTVKDFQMIEHSETKGLGTKVNDLWFRKGFIGKKPSAKNMPSGKSEFKAKLGIDAISGATYSSMAVVHAVSKDWEKYFSNYNKQQELNKAKTEADKQKEYEKKQKEGKLQQNPTRARLNRMRLRRMRQRQMRLKQQRLQGAQ